MFFGAFAYDVNLALRASWATVLSHQLRACGPLGSNRLSRRAGRSRPLDRRSLLLNANGIRVALALFGLLLEQVRSWERQNTGPRLRDWLEGRSGDLI
jgi:hypothetical protein